MRYVTTGERIEYEQGIQQGRQEGEQALILRQLQRRVGELSSEVRCLRRATPTQIESLSLTQLESLGEALLDFTSIEDLFNWLQANPPQ
ncbi:MAG: DUF4351 domain-containing protein [Gloeotrichia echinulata IR180]